MVVLEEDMLGGVDARMTVLAKPPEGQGAENGDRGVRGGGGVVGLEDIRPDDG